MAKLFSFFRKESVTPTIKEGGKFFFLTESLKGEVEEKSEWTNVLLRDVGEEHPFDFAKARKWATDEPFIAGVIEKYVDFVIGAGFKLESEDKGAVERIEAFFKKVGFKKLAIQWLREALITGNGFLELAGPQGEEPTDAKVLKSEYMFVKRDKKGIVKGYTQYRGNLKKVISFKPHEIAHFAHRRLGDSAYGAGLVFPLGFILSKKASMINHLARLMERKANSPYHVVLGDKEKDVLPKDSDVDAFKSKLDYLKREPEWVTDPYVEIRHIDFGKIGDKFTQPLEMMNQELFFGSQIPAVLMGMARIPEGLAKVQMDAFKRRTTAIQNEMATSY